MTYSAALVALLLLYCAACLAYVYRWRGRQRYGSLRQYLRKSWPVFAPLNCLLYMTTRRSARAPVIDAGYLHGVCLLRANWQLIRREGLALLANGDLDATCHEGSQGFHDLGFRTFYKRGWRKYYLTWYGTTHRSAQRTCPETLRLLARVPGVRGAMFSLLPPGAELTLHSDPLAGSLRYHLGLATPNDARCFINIDGQAVAWRDGKDFVFDETYPHHARNDTQAMRLILMCDVVRPMNLLGRLANGGFTLLARAMRVPNTGEDTRGVLTWLFAVLSPWRQAGLGLKRRHRKLYVLLKLLLNGSLLLSLLLGLYAMLEWFAALGTVLEQVAAP
ncbi:aspartyl/asparaginyl beta-hydroxylase domain-containing protein [Stenotrophomonas sp. 24(2023)]|uniref:aspartyl/asparaginyl beta-hydroxylase domain-containing protein n=1 Tax=Stenotrophomonas sp. 24(2023) TaxID=3068324 RepID=UPI0027E15CC7|nr:aspartyl/asparaginyl beta-hydroxylase domain-containing protein [Stenotrophomonas sp. 24(2023)]WMJ68213.1 aspartyl/asparaginyl beta-hydroxylase domain-containing protein [Stenotrophomonas sp. 24(2023)]